MELNAMPSCMHATCIRGFQGKLAPSHCHQKRQQIAANPMLVPLNRNPTGRGVLTSWCTSGVSRPAPLENRRG